jgi:cardiolipin synthase A/B
LDHSNFTRPDISDTEWKSEKLFFDGEVFFSELAKAIDQAQSSVNLETYIFAEDAIGKKIEHALLRAARRGVSVRLMVDGIGSSAWAEGRGRELSRVAQDKLLVRVFRPLFNIKSPTSSIASALLELGIRRKSSEGNRRMLSWLNRRNHRKLCVIDGKAAWVGSMNVSGKHCKSVSGDSAWRDTAALVEGAGVPDLLSGFEYAWLRSYSTDGKRRWRDLLSREQIRILPHSPLVRLNYTSRLRKRTRIEFINRIKKAQQRVWIITPYLAPSHNVTRQLRKAAQRGVDVKILVPRRSDVFFMPWVATAHYGPLLRSGVRIFEYLPRFLHAKTTIVDDWATVGTSNMNRRSLIYDYEVDVVISKARSLQELEWQFRRDLTQAEEVRQVPGGVAAWLGRLITSMFKNWI